MKKLLVLSVVGLFLVSVAPTTLSAQVVIPTGPSGTKVYYVDAAGGWSSWELTDPEALARCNHVGEIMLEGCNQKVWEIPMTIHASVAQWVEWSLTGEGWVWRIKKPGCYAANCISFTLKSNEDIRLDWQGFADLTSIGGNNHKETIDTWYGIGDEIVDAEATWTLAAELNANPFFSFFDESALNGTVGAENPLGWNLHNQILIKLWNKICVVDCNTACEYGNYPKLVITLENQKDWVDWPTGGWL